MSEIVKLMVYGMDHTKMMDLVDVLMEQFGIIHKKCAKHLIVTTFYMLLDLQKIILDVNAKTHLNGFINNKNALFNVLRLMIILA